jgi:hypothetical protein
MQLGGGALFSHVNVLHSGIRIDVVGAFDGQVRVSCIGAIHLHDGSCHSTWR